MSNRTPTTEAKMIKMGESPYKGRTIAEIELPKSKPGRTASWGNWGITFVLDGRGIEHTAFPLGPNGPWKPIHRMTT